MTHNHAILALLVLLRDYSNSFDLFNLAKLSSNRTGGNVQVKTENEKFIRRVLTYSTKLLVVSRCCLAECGEEM